MYLGSSGGPSETDAGCGGVEDEEGIETIAVEGVWWRETDYKLFCSHFL
jgi:hypothetical protein